MIHTSSVISGRGRGGKIGYPTLNLSIPSDLDSDHGIYAGWVIVGTQKYPGAFHYGPIPTFQEDTPSLEVFVLDHTFNPIPESVSFELVQKLRDIISFDSPQSLAAQISQDVTQTRQLLGVESN